MARAVPAYWWAVVALALMAARRATGTVVMWRTIHATGGLSEVRAWDAALLPLVISACWATFLDRRLEAVASPEEGMEE